MIRLCCKIGCEKQADYEVRSGPKIDDYTDSCIDHIPDLLDDSEMITLHRLREALDNPETPEQWRALGDAEALRACADELDPERGSAFEPCDLKIANKRITELEKERDNARANSVSRGKMLIRLRDRLINARDYLDDQGDLVAFGSTNDADDFRAVVNDLDMFKWDRIIREKDEDDLLSASARANARADKAEAERDSLRKALDDRFEADKKAAKAIMAAEGRTRGFPSVKDVVGFYMAQAEKLAEALEPYAKAHIDGLYSWPMDVHRRARAAYEAAALTDFQRAKGGTR